MSLWNHTITGCLVLFMSFFQTFAQDADTAVRYYESFFMEGNQKKPETLLDEAALLLDEAIATTDYKDEARVRKEIGMIHLTQTHDYQKAIDNFIMALAIEDSLNLMTEQIFTYLAIAQVFEEVGDYYKSEEFLNLALEINRISNNTRIQVLILNKLGKINAATGRIDEAFATYEHVLESVEEVNDPKVEAEAVFNLAHLYTQQGFYAQALEKHKSALAIIRSFRDKRKEALSLSDIGELYRLMENDERALANHIASLEIRQDLKDQKGMAASYNNIGALYYQQKNIDLAIANLQLALDAGRESQTQEQIRKSYEYLSMCYVAQEDYKKALEYKDLFLAISDFIQHEINEQQLLESQNRYFVEQKQSQIRKLESIRTQSEKQLSQERKIRNFLAALTGFGLVIAVLVIYLYLVKRRSNSILKAAHAKVQEQNVQLQDLNATKDKFFSIISHDLKGPLNSLTSFSGLLMNHTDSLSKEEIKMLAKDLDKSLKNLFALLENLLEWSRSQTGNTEFKQTTFDLAAVLNDNKNLLEGQAASKKITVKGIDKKQVPIHAHRHSVNTVIRNLISNAIKFTPEGGTITLAVQKVKNDVRVSIADTGVGMSAEVIQKLFRIDTKHTTKGTADEKGTGLGLILCKEFVEKNGGKIWAESEPGRGSVFYFTLPNIAVPIREEPTVTA